MLNLKNKKVTIFGAGKSGMALAALAHKQGAIVQLTNDSEISPETADVLNKMNVVFESGGHTKDFIRDSDYIVLSPGVSIYCELVRWAYEKGVVVYGEIEFASIFLPDTKIIAVTGSNGKTTVSSLIYQMLVHSGKQAVLCGNIGVPLSEIVVRNQHHDYTVVEVSSFQMESVRKDKNGFRPYVGVLLNFSQNHLDRHDDLDEYFEAKSRMFINQKPSDYAVLNFKDEKVSGLKKKLASQVEYFNKDNHFMNPNFDAVYAVARIVGVEKSVCKQLFNDFKGIEHRVEFVRSVDGIDFINDSKSTTVEATRWALTQALKPVILICGGRDKGSDFNVLESLLAQKVKEVFIYGESAKIIDASFNKYVPCCVCHDLKEALQKAHKAALKDSCVLLSPMCASFDQFLNYEERGRVFKSLVNQLQSKAVKCAN